MVEKKYSETDLFEKRFAHNRLFTRTKGTKEISLLIVTSFSMVGMSSESC